MAFFTVYILLCMFSYMVMMAAGIDTTNSVAIALSCACNVGPSLDVFGPVMSWTDLPSLVKWVLSALMLMGRLEIFSVLVLFTPSFWKDS